MFMTMILLKLYLRIGEKLDGNMDKSNFLISDSLSKFWYRPGILKEGHDHVRQNSFKIIIPHFLNFRSCITNSDPNEPIFSLWLYSRLDLGRFFSFLIPHTVGMIPWTGDQPVARPLPTHRTTRTQNKRTQTSMLLVGFEPMTPVFERAKTVHALDRVATVIGRTRRYMTQKSDEYCIMGCDTVLFIGRL
jgi:hypothetical protein